MNAHAKLKLLGALVLLACLCAAGTSAQEPRAPSEYFRFTSLNLTNPMGCGPGQISLNVTSFRSGTHYVGTFVTPGTLNFMDENATISTPGLQNHTWGLFNSNNRDRQTSTFPLPTNKQVTVESTMNSSNYEPQWRAVAYISKCNGGTMTAANEYKATELLNNNSFETADGGGDPTDWTANAAALVSPSGVDCSVGFPGTCSLRVLAQADAKIKYTQTWTGSAGVAGDTVELSLLQRLVVAGYAGGGKVIAKLTFANGAHGTIRIDATGVIGASSLGHFSNANLLMPAALVKAKVIIVQGIAPSGDWHIDGLALAIFHFRGSTLAPLAVPASGPGASMRGFDGITVPQAVQNGD